jgi:hypothetical protein
VQTLEALVVELAGQVVAEVEAPEVQQVALVVSAHLAQAETAEVVVKQVAVPLMVVVAAVAVAALAVLMEVQRVVVEQVEQ